MELQVVNNVLANAVVDYDLTNFDEVCRFFEDNNKGTESPPPPWSWDDSFKLTSIAFDLLWNEEITHEQYSRFWDAVSVPLF